MRNYENWWKRNSLAATLCGRAHNLITAWVHRNRNWITIYFFKNIRGLNPKKKYIYILQKTQLDKNPENVILCLVGEKVNAKTVATVKKTVGKKKNFPKSHWKTVSKKRRRFVERDQRRGRERSGLGIEGEDLKHRRRGIRRRIATLLPRPR